MFRLQNAALQDQLSALPEYLRANEMVWTVVEKAHELKLPNWYVGAGCLNQTIWNIQSGFPPGHGIKDIDIIYFDRSDLSEEAEKAQQERARRLFAGIPLELDVVNQARVHLWYEEYFGYPIHPYTSSEAAINTWPTTATALALRLEPSAPLRVYAPFGLNDVYGVVARANKIQITAEIYAAKTQRWKTCWPELTVIPWEKC